MDPVYIIDVLGTASFAISGVVTAMHKRLDPFGVLIIATVTSVGGGTLRDVLIGKTPVTWMLNMNFIYVIIVASVVAVLFRGYLKYVRRSLFLFDTIGISLYTITGVEIALTVGLHPIICMAVGTISACFGGVLRDILCNEIPVIFRKEIYASACILGALTYLALTKFNMLDAWAGVIAGSIIIIIRTCAVLFSWELPSIYKKEPL